MVFHRVKRHELKMCYSERNSEKNKQDGSFLTRLIKF